MNFIKPTLPVILTHLEKIEPHTQPIWGTMNVQEMVEHLTDVLLAAQEKIKVGLVIPEDKIDEYQKLMLSDHPIPKGTKAPYPKAIELRNEDLEIAIDELAEEWIAFEDFFEKHPDKTTLHPYFGQLNYEKWLIMHAKHITHHLTQFGVTIDSD